MSERIYDKYMNELYLVLNNTWKKQVKKAARDAIVELSSLPASQKPDNEFVEEMMQNTVNRLTTELEGEVAPQVRKINEKCYRMAGADTQKPLNISVGLYGNKQKVTVEKVNTQNLFWIRKHFGAEIQDKLKVSLAEALDKGYSVREFGDVLKGQFNNLNQSSHYWRGFANNAIARTKTIGSIEAMERHKIEKAKIVARMDDRTTDICRELNGRIIEVSHMIEAKNKMLDIKTEGRSTEDVKAEIQAVAPFFRNADQIRGKSTREIQSKGTGVGMPPYHWGCRTRIIAWVDEFDDPGAVTPGSNSDPNDKYAKNLTQTEMLEKWNGVKSKRYPTFSDGDLESDWKKHGQREFGFTDKREYIQKARDIYNNADRVTCRTFKGQLQFQVYSFEQKGYVVVDTNSIIRGCYGHSKPGGTENAYNYYKKHYYEITQPEEKWRDVN